MKLVPDLFSLSFVPLCAPFAQSVHHRSPSLQGSLQERAARHSVSSSTIYTRIPTRDPRTEPLFETKMCITPARVNINLSVLVQSEMEKNFFPLVKIPPLRGGDFRGMRASLLPAGAAVGAALPRACDHVSREFQLVGRRAYRAASHNRWRCVSGRCCSDPRRFESNALRLLSSAACPAGCTPILAICASAPACHSIADSRARFVHGSSPRCG